MRNIFNNLSKKAKIRILGLFIPLFLFSYFIITEGSDEKQVLEPSSPENNNENKIVEGVECTEIVDEAEYMYAGCNGFY